MSTIMTLSLSVFISASAYVWLNIAECHCELVCSELLPSVRN
jgi:hypothetical protein